LRLDLVGATTVPTRGAAPTGHVAAKLARPHRSAQKLRAQPAPAAKPPTIDGDSAATRAIHLAPMML